MGAPADRVPAPPEPEPKVGVWVAAGWDGAGEAVDGVGLLVPAHTSPVVASAAPARVALSRDSPERPKVACGVARRSLSVIPVVERVEPENASPPLRATGAVQPYWSGARNACAAASSASRPLAAKAWAATPVVFAFGMPSALSREPSPACAAASQTQGRLRGCRGAGSDERLGGEGGRVRVADARLAVEGAAEAAVGALLVRRTSTEAVLTVCPARTSARRASAWPMVLE